MKLKLLIVFACVYCTLVGTANGQTIKFRTSYVVLDEGRGTWTTGTDANGNMYTGSRKGKYSIFLDSNNTGSLTDLFAIYRGGSVPLFTVAGTGAATMYGALDMSNHQIHNLADPTSPQDAATQTYVTTQASTRWSLTGNAGTSYGTNFLGTTDAQNLQFRVNNQQAGLIEWNGNQNTGMGYQVLKNNTSGFNNTAGGSQALFSNTGGYQNTANGYNALYSNTDGSFNTASGYQSLYSNTGYYNTAIGHLVLYSNTTGGANTAIGVQAMRYSTTGNNNTAIGSVALTSNRTGDYNTALGYQADIGNDPMTNATAIGAHSTVSASNSIQLGDPKVTLVNTEGAYQTGNGMQVIFRNPAGTFNSTFKAGAQTAALDYTLPTTAPAAGTFLGSDVVGNLSWVAQAVPPPTWTLSGNTGTIYGTNFIGTTDAQNLQFRVNNQQAGLIEFNGNVNTGIGYQVLQNNTSGYDNTAIGVQALTRNTTGYGNTAMGVAALFSEMAGSFNSAFGYHADVAYGLTNATAIGANAGVLASNSIQLGDHSLTLVTTYGSYQTGKGQQVIFRSPGSDYNTTFKAGLLQNYPIDYTLPVTAPAAGNSLISDASGNLSWGNAGWGLNGNAGTVYGTNFIGTTDYQSLQFRVNNQQAGLIDLNSGNTGLGYLALQNNGGRYNTASGGNALQANTGSLNTASGSEALVLNTTGSANTASGESALPNNTTGTFNTALGFFALQYNTTGSNNTALGSFATVASGGLTNATAIGANSSVDASNSVQLGDPFVTKVQTSGDVYVYNQARGIILRSPVGDCWRVTVSNGGVLTTTKIPCP